MTVIRFDIIPFTMEFRFRTRTLCVPHTHAQAHHKHLFSTFQFIVSSGMRIHKIYASIEWEKMNIPPQVWNVCFAVVRVTVFHDMN